MWSPLPGFMGEKEWFQTWLSVTRGFSWSLCWSWYSGHDSGPWKIQLSFLSHFGALGFLQLGEGHGPPVGCSRVVLWVSSAHPAVFLGCSLFDSLSFWNLGEGKNLLC